MQLKWLLTVPVMLSFAAFFSDNSSRSDDRVVTTLSSKDNIHNLYSLKELEVVDEEITLKSPNSLESSLAKVNVHPSNYFLQVCLSLHHLIKKNIAKNIFQCHLRI